MKTMLTKWYRWKAQKTRSQLRQLQPTLQRPWQQRIQFYLYQWTPQGIPLKNLHRWRDLSGGMLGVGCLLLALYGVLSLIHLLAFNPFVTLSLYLSLVLILFPWSYRKILRLADQTALNAEDFKYMNLLLNESIDIRYVLTKWYAFEQQWNCYDLNRIETLWQQLERLEQRLAESSKPFLSVKIGAQWKDIERGLDQDWLKYWRSQQDRKHLNQTLPESVQNQPKKRL